MVVNRAMVGRVRSIIAFADSRIGHPVTCGRRPLADAVRGR